METLATRYVRLQEEMQTLRFGESLAAAADAVEAALPRRRLLLISTSDEGAGLAAVCASRRGAGTAWMKVNLLAAEPVADDVDVVVVEPVDAGAAWRKAVERVYPGSCLLVVSALHETAAVAA